MSILVVEDDRSVREMLIETLTEEGFAAVGVADGLEALAHLEQAAEPPCLILLDLMMPRMDGWQFLYAQRDHPGIASIPVILLSARPDGQQHAERLLIAGYIPKPFDFDRLLAEARRFCPC